MTEEGPMMANDTLLDAFVCMVAAMLITIVAVPLLIILECFGGLK